MPELRLDRLRGEYVVIAAERAARPHQFEAISAPSADATDCPFCPGNERETPREVYSVRDPTSAADAPGWELRVFPNKYPAFAPGSLAPGAHEVVIETEQHDAHPADYGPVRMLGLLKCFRERTRRMFADGFRHVLVFRNDGALSGASLPHAHSQIVALPEPPPEALKMAAAFRAHADDHGGCLLCDELAEERSARERVVAEADGWIALAPYASRFAWQVRIAPLAHPAPFAQSADDGLEPFARLLRDLMGRLREAVGRVSCNWILHAGDAVPHWHLDLLPRTARIGGFELGSGIFLNSVTPEAAAEKLRESGVRSPEAGA